MISRGMVRVPKSNIYDISDISSCFLFLNIWPYLVCCLLFLLKTDFMINVEMIILILLLS